MDSNLWNAIQRGETLTPEQYKQWVDLANQSAQYKGNWSQDVGSVVDPSGNYYYASFDPIVKSISDQLNDVISTPTGLFGEVPYPYNFDFTPTGYKPIYSTSGSNFLNWASANNKDSFFEKAIPGLILGTVLGPAGVGLTGASLGATTGALTNIMAGGNPLKGAFLGGATGYLGGELFGKSGGSGYDAGSAMDAAIAEGAANAGYGATTFPIDMSGPTLIGDTAALPMDQVGAMNAGGNMDWTDVLGGMFDEGVGAIRTDPFSNVDYGALAAQDFADFGVTGVEALGDALNYSTGAADFTQGIQWQTQMADILRNAGMDTNTALNLASNLKATDALKLAQALGGGGSSAALAGLTKAITGQNTGLMSGLGSMFSNLTDNLTKNINAGQVAQTAAYTAAMQAQANAAKEAAQAQANAQLEAAKIAADAAKFRPVGVTTGFGSSKFGFDPTTGYLTSAGYELTPEMKAQQDALLKTSNSMLDQFKNSQTATAPLGSAAQQAMGIGAQGLATGTGLLSDAANLRPNIAALLKQTAPIGAAGQQALGLGTVGMNLAQSVLSQADQFRPDIAALLKQTAPVTAAGQQALGMGTSGMNLGQSLIDQAAALRPDVAALQKQTAPLGTAGQSAMSLGQQYLGTDPAAQAAKYMAEQQALLAPTREREYAALQNKLAQQGRLGLATGGTSTGMMAANPEVEALMNARRQQDLNLAAQATQGGMDYAKFGATLAGTGGDLVSKMYGVQNAAYDPYKTALGVGQQTSQYGTGMAKSGTDLLQSAYGVQNAALDPYKSMLDIGTQLGQYGTGMSKAGTDLMQSMYGVQNAAYDPYKTATNLGMDYTKFGTGMYGAGGDLLNQMYGTQTAAFNPYKTALGGATTLESLGQNALDLGMTLGGKVTAANTNVGNALSQGTIGSANAMAASNAYSPWANLLSGVGGLFSNTNQQQQYKFDPFTGKAL